ncbi:MAG TPA: peptidoglycan-binding protein [Hyphomonadaceae bacterium]|nr:peptidoglycan-binding protein [Hyphomonadaceae bacterium]
MTQGPWSVKGIDPKARSIARERAQRQGVTLGQYLNSLLLDPDSPAPSGNDGMIQEVDLGDAVMPAADGDIRRMSQEIDMLSQRLEASTSRSARAIAGIDKSILGLMGKVDASGRAQLTALERVTRAMGEIETTQTALRSRIDSLENEHRGGATVDALKTLEASLGRLAENVQDRLESVERDASEFHNLFDEKVGRVSEKVDDFARSMDQALNKAVSASSAGLNGRVDQIEQQMSAVERRMEGALGRITDAASRFEMFETKAERAVGDTTWRMERALETSLTRSRAISKELLDRVDGIEEKTREAVGALGDAVNRITERIGRAERKTDSAFSVVERAVSDIDERIARGNRSVEDFTQIQSLFQKRLDSLAEDLSRPIHAVRADVEKRLEEAFRSGVNPEKLDRLERSLRQVQDQIQVSEARQADAVEAMSAQVERLSRAVDERLRAVEARGDQRSIDDVRREMRGLADTIDSRLGGAVDTLRSEIGRLNTSVDDRVKTLETRSAGAIDAVGEQIALVAERLQRRHDESIQRLSDRITETAADSRQLDPAEVDRIAERLDERVRESERRSAEAIGQIGEQVARVADRLQVQHQDSLRTLEQRLAESGRSHESRLAEVLSDMSRRMDEIGDQSAAALAPMHKTVSSLARRLEEMEDGGRPRSAKASPAIPREIPVIADEYVVLDDVEPDTATSVMPAAAAIAAVVAADQETDDIVGVEPPPFDRPSERSADKARDAQLFADEAAPPLPPLAEPAKEIEDLLETDDVVLAPAAPLAKGEFVADLPADDIFARPGAGYLEEARRAAREGRRITAGAAAPAKKGLGKGPLIASAALAVAVAGGGVLTVMRGKQEAKPDDFAKLEPAAPVAAEAGSSPDSAAADLFGEETPPPVPAGDIPAPASGREPAASDLFDGPGKPATAKPGIAPVAATAAVGKPAADTGGSVTLVQAVQEGDPVALHDYALELLQTGEKPKAVLLLKDAASRGLVMAEYRLAKLYEKGEGVPRDMAASRAWTEKAAIGGNVKAMHDLAVFYAEGDAGPQSYAAAVEWFRQASDLGLVDSQYNLAVLYEQGLGLTQDKAEAAYWFEVAGRAGDQDAARRARALFGDMQSMQAEQIKRRARAFNPKPSIARANGDFGRRPWDMPTPVQISETQRLLEKLGFNPGATDGKMTTRTEDAIRAFERANDLPVTGEASVSLLRQLRAATLGPQN